MHRPQKLVAVLFSAALLCTTGIALADKGGNHGNPHGGPPGQSGSAPGQSGSAPGQSNGNNNRGPGGLGGPMSAPGQNVHAGAHGSQGLSSVNGFQGNFGSVTGSQVNVTFANGSSQSFTLTTSVQAALKTHANANNVIFFTNGSGQITAISFPGETTTMKVVSRQGNTFTLQGSDGQSRLIALDNKTISRLHVGIGSNLQITTKSATGGKIVALDMVRAHQFDKFGTSTSGHSTAFSRQAAQLARMNAAGHFPPGLPHQCINPAGNTRGWCKSHGGSTEVASASASVNVHASARAKAHAKLRAGQNENDNDQVSVAGGGKCGPGKSRNGNPAFANQMAKDAANDASGHNPPGLPHECVNPAGHTRGFCKSSSSESVCGGASGSSSESVASSITANTKTHTKARANENQNEVAQAQGCPPGRSSSRRGNPAFANQMAKDAANDASGHNPPGLPHECVNPAGHTRGFCKSRESSSSAMCGSGAVGGESVAASNTVTGGTSGSGSTATSPANLHGGIASAARTRGESSGARGPGAPVGFIPAGGMSNAGGSSRGVAGRAAAPTHVLGAAVGPAARGARPTRVLPVAIQPVGKRRCVWYKTGVLAASTGGYRIVGTSAISGKPKLHKKCK